MTLIEKLTYAEELLQTDALNEAAESYDLIKDELHAAIRLAPSTVKKLEAASGREYALKYFAMFLAAENRDKETFSLIINFFASYDQDAWDCLSEITTRDAGRILASVFPGNINTLKAAVELPGMNSFARISCFDALGTLMREGVISRNDLIQCFRVWLKDDKLNIFEHSALANTCVDLSLCEMQQELLVLFENEQLDSDEISRERVKHNLRDSDIDDLLAHMFSLINNATSAIGEIRIRGYMSVLAAMYEYSELQALIPLFKYEEENNGIISPEFLHGFMFAVVITPGLILPSEWQPALFPDGIPLLETSEDIETAMMGLMQCYNQLNSSRLDGLLHCPFDQVAYIDTGLAPMARAWCEGFGLGITLRRQYWIDHQMSDVFKSALSTIMIISDEKIGTDLLKQAGRRNSSSERSKLFRECLDNLPNAVEILIQDCVEYDAEYSPDVNPYLPSEPVRSQKVGRNAPCPCGSGKKFKKCCGAPGRSVH